MRNMAPQAHISSGLRVDRVDWVDCAKGICIILVVMMHTTLGLEAASGDRGWMHAVVEFSRPFRMPDFFVISGLFLAATINRPWRLYLDRKVVHFFYFYVLWVAIQFAFKAPFMVMDGNSASTVLRTFLFTAVQPFGTLWFIYMLPVFFVVTKLFKNFKWWLLGAAAVLQIAPIHTQAFFPPIASALGLASTEGYLVLIDEFAAYYVFFLGGYLFAPHIFRLANIARENISIAITTLSAWFLINLILVQLDWASLPIVSLLLGAAGAMAIVFAASLLVQNSIVSPLTKLGANSIVVYLAFFLPMIIMRLLMLKFTPWIDAGTMAFVGTLVAVVSPMIGYWIIEKIRFGHFLFHRPAWAIIAEAPSRTRAALAPAE